MQGVGGINTGDILQAHLLNQPILQRQVGALIAALGLRAVGTERIVLLVMQYTPELRHVGASCLGLTDAKHRVLITSR